MIRRGFAVIAAACCVVVALSALAWTHGTAAGPSPPAAASTTLASFTSADCGNPQAPVWKAVYVLYWRSKNGMTTDRSQLDTILSETNTFVQDVATFSRCGARMHLDVIDAGSAVFDGNDGPPSGHDALLKLGYDSVFYRYPGADDQYSGLSGGSVGDRWSIFPITSDWTASGPWEMLEMHEWLHQVVAFESQFDDVIWPSDDVHGGCKIAPYSSDPSCLVSAQYFSDLMSGNVNVNVNGKLTGIKPGQWAYHGTPTAPRHLDPDIAVDVDNEQYTITASVSEGQQKQATITVSDQAGHQLVSHAATVGKPWLWPALKQGGTFTVCADIAEQGAYAAAHTCTKQTLAATTAGLVWLSKPVYRAHTVSWTLHAKGVLLGRRAQLTINAGSLSGQLSYRHKLAVRLHASQRFTLPFKPGTNWNAYFGVFLPAFVVAGRHYTFTGIDASAHHR